MQNNEQAPEDEPIEQHPANVDRFMELLPREVQQLLAEAERERAQEREREREQEIERAHQRMFEHDAMTAQMLWQLENGEEDEDEEDEAPEWLHPTVRSNVANGGFFFTLGGFARSNVLLLDHRNAEHVVSHLVRKPRIDKMVLRCNFHREDGAMGIMEEFFRNGNQHITDIVLHQQDDNLSTLECLANGLHDGSTITSVEFPNYDFTQPGSSELLQTLLQNKTNLNKLEFRHDVTLDSASLRQVVLTQTSLEKLLIYDRSIWSHGNIAQIFNLLAQLETVQVLHLSVDRLSLNKSKEFMHALKLLVTTDGCKIQNLRVAGVPPEAEGHYQDVFSANTSLLEFSWTGLPAASTAHYLARNADLGRVQQMKEAGVPLGLWPHALDTLLRLRFDVHRSMSPSHLAVSHFLPHAVAQTAPMSRKPRKRNAH